MEAPLARGAAPKVDVEARCDGIDNDKDGEVDEGFGVGEPCGLGACEGVIRCNECGVAAMCPTMPGLPEDRSAPEKAGDGVDNDCDGLTDESP